MPDLKLIGNRGTQWYFITGSPRPNIPKDQGLNYDKISGVAEVCRDRYIDMFKLPLDVPFYGSLVCQTGLWFELYRDPALNDAWANEVLNSLSFR